MRLRIALGMYLGEPCRICRRSLEPGDLPDLVFAGYSHDNKARVAHGVCWDNFVDLLQTLPSRRLHELINGKVPRGFPDGQRENLLGEGQ